MEGVWEEGSILLVESKTAAIVEGVRLSLEVIEGRLRRDRSVTEKRRIIRCLH